MNPINYIKEVRGELTHVSWPTQKQVAAFTALVIGISAVVALFLGVIDVGLQRGLEVVLRGAEDAQVATPPGADTGVDITTSADGTLEIPSPTSTDHIEVDGTLTPTTNTPASALDFNETP